MAIFFGKVLFYHNPEQNITFLFDPSNQPGPGPVCPSCREVTFLFENLGL